MIRTIVALDNAQQQTMITQALTHRGIDVRCRCTSGAEVIRAVRQMGGGVVICPFKLCDMSVLELADRLNGQAFFLVIVKGSQRSFCERDDCFTLTAPVHTAELAGAVHMLLQLDARRAAQTIPKRSDEARTVISEAKALLMARHGMTEPQAHRLLQDRSMQSGIPMADVAQMLLASQDTP